MFDGFSNERKIENGDKNLISKTPSTTNSSFNGAPSTSPRDVPIVPNHDKNEISCIGRASDSNRIDSTKNSNLANLNLSEETPTSSQIKKKSSSFLHRDYNRKPILARSQVSSRHRLSKSKVLVSLKRKFMIKSS